MNTCSHRATCRLCNSDQVSIFLPLAASPIADAYVPESSLAKPQQCFEMDLYICKNCGHVQLLDVIAPEEIYREYLYVTHSSPGLVAYYKDYARDVTEWAKLPSESFVMDIGSNDGALLQAFKNLGMRVLGVDPATEIARTATSNGIPTIPEFLTPDLARKIRQEHGPAKLITANNIVANVDDLHPFFESISELLADDGLFVLESGYWLDILQNMLFDTVYHEHLSYFSIQPLQKFFLSTPLNMIHAFHTPSKGGCLRYVFARRERGIAPTAELLAMKEREQQMGLDTYETNAAYAARINACKADVIRLFDEIKSKNGSIAVYGASNTTTTLLYHFELAKYIDYIVDDNPIKIGLFSPGLHIPVLSPEVIYKKRPDYIFVAAWRFYTIIVDRHPAYSQGGGKWIVPLPKLFML